MSRISKNQLIKLHRKYKSDSAIAALYGITRQAVHKMRKKYGILAIKDKYETRNKKIVNDYKNGISVKKLAKKYKLTKVHIYRILKKYGEKDS